MFGLLSADCLQTNKASKAASLSPTPVAGNDAVVASAVLTGAGRLDPVEKEVEEEECVFSVVCFTVAKSKFISYFSLISSALDSHGSGKQPNPPVG